MAPSLVRPLYVALGLLLCAIGYVGLFVPVLPATDFFLLALIPLSRSSPRLESWIMLRSPAAPALQDWRRERAMRSRTKWIAIAWLWLSLLVSVLLVKRIWLKLLLVCVGLGVTAFLATRPRPTAER